MAQYKIDDPEQLKECPYDKVHMVAAKRMQYHLMKCRRNHPGAEFAVCPYNARHEVRKPELRYHMTNCPDKARLEPSILYEQNQQNGDGQYFKGCTDLPNYEANGQHVTVENWDADIPRVARIGVDPSYFLRLNARDTAGLSNKEKRQYRAQVDLPPEERFAPDPEEEVEEQKLRLPHAKPQTYMSLPGNIGTPMGQIPPSTSVLALSLSKTGVGRGQVGGRGVALAPGPMPIGRGLPGVGRAAGRGIVSMVRPGHPPGDGYTAISPNTVNASSNGHTVLAMATQQPGPMAGLSANQQSEAGVALPNQQAGLGMPAANQQSALGMLSANQQPGLGMSAANQQPGLGMQSANQQPGLGISSASPQLGRGYGQVADQQVMGMVNPQFGRGMPLVNGTHNVFSMGVGRGRGIGRGAVVSQNGSTPSFVVPNVRGDASKMSSSGSEAEEGTATSTTMTETDKKKEKRRLEKKLRQIELLEEKVTEGYTMTSEEEIKCEKKDELLEAIQKLQI